MATERDFELLDDYITNRLSAEEKVGFEQKLQSDPDLKREYSLQQRLVKAIKDKRIAELKSLLNNTPIPPVNPGTSAVAKFAIGTFVAGAVATGAYFYFNNDNITNQHVTTPPEQTEEASKPADTLEEPTPEPPSVEGEESKEPSNNPAEMSTPITGNKKNNEKAKVDSNTLSSNQKPALDVFDPSADNEEVNSKTNTEAEQAIKGEVKEGPSIAVEIDRSNKRYAFHYQFKEGKLFLYGPFEKNLYEIMEFFSDEKRTLFLFYKDGYYLLKEEDTQVKPLAVITDQALVQKLKEYRGN